MDCCFNFNYKVDSIVNELKFLSSNYNRVASIAIPFISLHKKGAIASFAVMSSVQIYTNANELVRDLINKDVSSATEKVYRLTLIVSSVAFAILLPNVQLFLSAAYSSFHLINKLNHQIKNNELQKGLFTLIELINEITHVASVYYGGLGILATSLLVKTIVEFSTAYVNYYENGKTVEAVANCLMGLVRGYQGVAYAKSLYRNYYGQQLTDEILKEILDIHEKKIDQTQSKKNTLIIEDCTPSFKKIALAIKKIISTKEEKIEQLDLDHFLEERGISSHIKGLNLKKVSFLGWNFKHIKFSECNFWKCKFNQTTFEQTEITNSFLTKTVFIDSTIRNCIFSSCDFFDSSMIKSTITQTKFIASFLDNTCWNHSTLKDVCFEKSSLSYAHFFDAKAIQCRLKEMIDLTNCFLFEAESGFEIVGIKPTHDLPVVAMEWNFEYNGMMAPLIYEALNDSNVFSMRVDFSQLGVDVDQLQKEVSEAINSINEDVLSLPQEILIRSDENSEITKIQQMAAKIIRYSNGLSLPGGSDIEPEFYRKIRESRTYPEENYLRSICEFSLIDQAIKQRKPIMGTCRGSQIINVFLGGTLKQHIPGHYNVLQDIKAVEGSKWADQFKERLGEEFVGLAMHHQAADKMGEDLEVLYECEGIPKLYTSKDGLILGSQIHPEAYLYFKDESKIQAYLDEIKEFWMNLNKKHENGLIDKDKFNKLKDLIFIELEQTLKLKKTFQTNKEIYSIFIERIHKFMDESSKLD